MTQDFNVYTARLSFSMRIERFFALKAAQKYNIN